MVPLGGEFDVMEPTTGAGSAMTKMASLVTLSTADRYISTGLEAEKVIYLSDVPGLLRDVDDPSSLVARVAVADAKAMVADGSISGGMIPKITACIDAVEAGAKSAHMLDGRVPHVLLLELFTDAGIGTMLTTPTKEGE